MEETVQNTSGGYNKRPLWQWLVIYLILGVVIYGAIYYFFLSKNNNYNKSAQQYISPSPSQTNLSTSVATNKEMTFVLKPANSSNEGGTAILKEENGQTKVTINLIGYTKDIEQPVHIHVGKCPRVGNVKYPLTSVVNGTSTTLLSVTLESLKKELPLAINVHKSKTEIASYTSCGPLNIE